MPTNIYICIFLKIPLQFLYVDFMVGFFFFFWYISSPQLFWHQGRVSWTTIFPRTGGVGNGFRMIQVHYINCAFCFYFVVISEYSTLTLGIGFVLYLIVRI